MRCSGENGAGKSTLVKMIYGILKPDAGEIFWKGQRVDITSPAHARSLGVAMVFQHFSLFDSLTVFENIVLGMDASRRTPYRAAAEIADISTRYGLPLDPDRTRVTPCPWASASASKSSAACCSKPEAAGDGRAHFGTDAPGSGEAVRNPAPARRRGHVHSLHQPQAGGDPRALHRHATILRGGKVVDSRGSADPREETPASLAANDDGRAALAAEPEAKAAYARRVDVRLALNHLDVSPPMHSDHERTSTSRPCAAARSSASPAMAGNGQDRSCSRR